MARRQKAIVRPLFQELTGVDDQCLRDSRNLDPDIPLVAVNAQAGAVGEEKGEKRGVDVGSNAELVVGCGLERWVVGRDAHP